MNAAKTGASTGLLAANTAGRKFAARATVFDELLTQLGG